MIHTDDPDFTLYQGDVLEQLATIDAGSVHCAVTSPPYWGLRDYGAEGQLGLESTPGEYVDRMVAVFRELRRVLRDDGTLWLNIGDSYNAYNGNRSSHGRISGSHRGHPDVPPGYGRNVKDLKPKDLVGIPWRLAFALQDDGWYLRADVIWSKPNPMPESVADRPTKSHEYLFLLAKSRSYFYDQEAVREPYREGPGPAAAGWMTGPGAHSTIKHARAKGGDSKYAAPTLDGSPGERPRGPDGRRKTVHDHATPNSHENYDHMGTGNERWPHPAGRNIRSVWEIATQPYPDAHFATFPEELVRRCILAGTSERGCCPVCGKPWEREVERIGGPQGDHTKAGKTDGADQAVRATGRSGRAAGSTLSDRYREHGYARMVTHGWRPGCSCAVDHDVGPHQPIPCTVFDPFLGSGTTAYVARRLHRRAIGIELSTEYCDLAARRLQQQSLFA